MSLRQCCQLFHQLKPVAPLPHLSFTVETTGMDDCICRSLIEYQRLINLPVCVAESNDDQLASLESRLCFDAD